MPNPFRTQQLAPSAPITGGNPFRRLIAPEEEVLPPEDSSLLENTFDVLGTPGRMIAGVVRGLQEGENPLARAWENRPTFAGGIREDDFDDVLADAGFNDTVGRRAAGFVGDVVLDPLNLVPVSPLAKGVAAGGNAALKVLRELPLVEDFGKKFVPYYGLDKYTTKVQTPVGEVDRSFQDLRRLHQSRLDHVREEAGQRTLDMFPQLSGDEAYEIAKALDTGATLPDPKLDVMRGNAKGVLDAQFAKEVEAGVMNPNSKRADYITHMLIKDPVEREMKFRALTAKNPFRVRREMTLEQGVDAGVFEKDVRRAVAHRLSTGDRAIANKEFFEETAKLFGKKLAPDEIAPQGFREASRAGDEAIAGLQGTYFPQEIAGELEKFVTLKQQPGPLAKLAEGTTALWKGYATRANPGFHARNAVSNVVQTWMGGLGDSTLGVMNPKKLLGAHLEAQRIVRGKAKVPTKIGAYSREQIEKAFDEYGVVGGAHTSFNELDDIVEGELKHAGRGVIGRNLDPLDRRNLLLRKGADVGNVVENTARVALFLDQLRKGRTLEDAALHVRKYLFDYSELTDTEKTIRNTILPFYTWMRKNIPLQVENVLTQPHKVAAIGKGFDAVEDTTQDRGMSVPANEIPDWMRDYIQLPMETEGGDPTFAAPSLPVQDINRLGMLDPTNPEEALGEAQRTLLGGMNPLLRVPLELWSNHQMFTDAPIYKEGRLSWTDTGGLKRANPIAEQLHNLSPEMARLLSIVETNRGVEMGALPDYLMRQFPWMNTMGRLTALTDINSEDDIALGADPNKLALAGLPTRVLTPQQRNAERKRQLQAERARRRDILREQARVR